MSLDLSYCFIYTRYSINQWNINKENTYDTTGFEIIVRHRDSISAMILPSSTIISLPWDSLTTSTYNKILYFK